MIIFDDNIKPYLVIMLGVIMFCCGIALIPRFVPDHKAHFASAVWFLYISVLLTAIAVGYVIHK